MDEGIERGSGGHRRRRVHRDGGVDQRRGSVANVRQGRRADTLQARAGGFGWLNRRRRGESFVSWRSGELLHNIPKIILVDIVHRRLMLRRRLKKSIGIAIERMRIERRRRREVLGGGEDRFGDLMG